jgi:hypothetical protein
LGAFEGAARRSRHSKQPTASSPADVMAKRSQGLLDVGALSHGLLAVSEVICGSSAGGGRFPPPPAPRGAVWAAPGAGPGPVWVQLRPPRPPREGAVPDSPVQNKMTRIALTGRSKIAAELVVV